MDDVEAARAYLVSVASGKGTMARQGTATAIARLNPSFVVNLAGAIKQARAEGMDAGVFSAYRPPGYGVGGFSDKYNSLHAYGLAVDVSGIGGAGTATAKRFGEIAKAYGVHNPYGYKNGSEFNHFQGVPEKGEVFVRSHPEIKKTIGSMAPIDLNKMWAAAGLPGPTGVASLVPPNDIPNPTSTTLRKGMSDRSTNGAVSQLQRQLIAAGFDVGKHGADGVYGKDTAKAVAALTKQYGLATGGDASAAGPRVQTALRNQGSVDNIASVLGFNPPAGKTATQPMSAADIAFRKPVDLGEIGTAASPGFPSVWGEQPAPGGFGPPPLSTFPARRSLPFSNVAPDQWQMGYPGVGQPPVEPPPYEQSVSTPHSLNSGVARGAPFPAPPMSFAANDMPLPRPRPSTVTMTGSAAGGLGRDVAMGAGSTASDKWQPLSLAPPPPENDPNIRLTGSAEGGLGRGVAMGAGYDTPGASWASMKWPAAGTDVLSGMKTSTPFEAPGTSINDVLKGVGGIPDALGWQTVKGWFGGEEPVAAKPSLYDRVPSAVQAPYGVPSDITPYTPVGEQQSSIGGFPRTSLLAGTPQPLTIDKDVYDRIDPGRELPFSVLKSAVDQINAANNAMDSTARPAKQAATLTRAGSAGFGGVPQDNARQLWFQNDNPDARDPFDLKAYPAQFYEPGWGHEDFPGQADYWTSHKLASANPNFMPSADVGNIISAARAPWTSTSAASAFDPGGAKLPAAGDQAPPAVSAGIDGVTFGDLPAHIPGGFGAPPAAMPTPRQIQSAPQQQDGRDYFSPTGRSSNGQSYASLGAGGRGASMNALGDWSTPFYGAASLPYAQVAGGFQTPSGSFSNSPFTPMGYTAPNFNPTSGGPSYAYQPNGFGGGTYVDSHGNVHTY